MHAEFGSPRGSLVLSRAVGAEALSQDPSVCSARTERSHTERPPSDGAREEKTSRFLWGIDWAEWLPRRFTDDGIELHESRIESAMPFISAHYGEIFEEDLERGR